MITPLSNAVLMFDSQPMDIAVRAYVRRDKPAVSVITAKIAPKKHRKKKVDVPSEWVVVFDAETTTDASQKLRFGTYQIRKGESLVQAGIFYDGFTLSKNEQKLLKTYAAEHHLTLLTVAEFIEDVFYGVGYNYRASIVGLNLPFDISRLAIDHCTAHVTSWSKLMQGGFSFKLSENLRRPRVQIRHASSRQSFIQFAATFGQRTTRGGRKKGRIEPVRRGYFVDIKTLAAALTSRSHSLASLANALGVESQKRETEEHGRVLTVEYIDYAVRDTQTTWECFVALKEIYTLHGLSLTAPHQILSEASLGKAYLKEQGVKPWRQMQPDFPPELIGIIMSTYYGGRSEVHIRRDVTQVLYCDFLSMYPTVCTLMGLWQFVIAQGMTWQDTTDTTREFLERVTTEDLQHQETWQQLCTLVQVIPNGEVFPVRAKYGDEAQYTIGSNHLTSESPLWFTLADCISAKLLTTGRVPHIVQAISFAPKQMQNELKPINIAGNAAYRVDPCEGDFFKQIIDLRSSIKKRLKIAPIQEKAELDSQQRALKILANSTSYGIFVELNVEEEKQLQPLLCYGSNGKPTPIQMMKFEAPGSFFHPLLATLITGGARLKLAVTERLACDAGLDWALCDTDSMALAKPESMPEAEFYTRARQAQEWFTPLNPYAVKEPLLKIEDYNYSLSDTKLLHPLYCYAISSKRYGLFNRGIDDSIILRKVSAHGLGHLIAPYQSNDISMLEDVQPWQQDLWSKIIMAAIHNHHDQPDFGKLRNFDAPAISRYGATTAGIAKWFAAYNAGKPYRDQVKPFNFLHSMQMQPQYDGSLLQPMRPVAPFGKNLSHSVSQCFDRMTGRRVTAGQLKTYGEALAQYHLHPETKFLNGDYLDRGVTQRRHIKVKSIQHIGKEANKWEEQFYMGADPDAQIEYGISSEQHARMLAEILQAIKSHGGTCLANTAELSAMHVLKIYKGTTNPSDEVIRKLYAAAQSLEALAMSKKILLEKTKAMIAARNIPIRTLAVKFRVDASNLAKILAGRRVCNSELLEKFAAIYKNSLF